MMRINHFLLSLTAVVIGFSTTASVSADTATATKGETITIFGDTKMVVPAEFKRVEPKSRIIEHEFSTKGEEDATARITMMAAGGDVKANIDRWKGQFTEGDKEAQKTEEMKVGNWVVHLVDVNGNFAERMGGGPFAGGKVINRTDYAMTGVILVHPEGKKYFVKMIGPKSVVKANREALVEMIKGIE